MAGLLQKVGFSSTATTYFYLRYGSFNGTAGASQQRVAQVFTVAGSGTYTPLGMWLGNYTSTYTLDGATNSKWQLLGVTETGLPDPSNIIIDWTSFHNTMTNTIVSGRDGSMAYMFNTLLTPLQKGTKYAFVFEQFADASNARPISIADTITDWQGCLWDGASWSVGTPRNLANYNCSLLYYEGTNRVFIPVVAGFETISSFPNDEIGGPETLYLYNNGSAIKQAGIRYDVGELNTSGATAYLDWWCDTDLSTITIRLNRLVTQVESTTTYNTRGSYAGYSDSLFTQEASEATLLSNNRETHAELDADYLQSAIGSGFWIEDPTNHGIQYTLEPRLGQPGLFAMFLVINMPDASTTDKTFTADGYNKATTLKTLLSDAYIKGTSEESITVDSIIAARLVKELSLDGYISIPQYVTISVDGYILGTLEFTFTSDGIISSVSVVRTYPIIPTNRAYPILLRKYPI